MMSVVTNQGDVYIINKTADYSFQKARQLLNEIRATFDDEIDDKEFVKRFLKKSKRGGIEYVKGK